MRPALISFVIILTSAILVMVGGERLSRREVESRTPADRDRLLDLDQVFRAELARLDSLYLSHLDDLAEAALDPRSDELTTAAGNIHGVSLVRVFRRKGKELTVQPDRSNGRLPEVELTEGKRPLDPGNAVVLDSAFLDGAKSVPEKWPVTFGSNPGLQVHLRQPAPGTLVVFLVDLPQVRKCITGYFAKWIEAPLIPLRESGERLMIDQPDGGILIEAGPERHGPAASIIPIRSQFGEWQIRSWDGLVVGRTHDPATLIIAGTLAVLVVFSGLILIIQQNRAMKLAVERVSFVNRVSHEFGAPLTNLSLNLDLASEFMTTRPTEARKRIGLVGEEVQRLSRLVANVLTFSRQSRDTMEVNPVRCYPGEVVRKVIESFRASLDRHGIVIEVDIAADEAVLLDPDALSQITGNLLSNVDKYAASGRWLGVKCELVSGRFILEIADRGEGIPSADRERIFAPFERVRDGVNEGASGTGLGLAIGRDLARRMGGELGLLDRPSGTVFRLNVPAPPALSIVSQTQVA